MPGYNRKRKGMYAQGSRENPIMVDDDEGYYGVAPPHFKKARVERPMSAPGRKVYTPRTPGGNVVAENHYFDTERTSTSIAQSPSTWLGSEMDPNTTAMLCLGAPVIGDDISNRTGRKIFVKKIRISGVITVPFATAQTNQREALNIRLVCYQDQQTNFTQATGDLVLAQGASSNAIHYGMSVANFGRFKILKDKRFVINPPDYSGLTTAYVAAGRVVNFKMNIKVNQWVNFNATNGGTVADIVDNSFHFLALSNVTTMVGSIAYKSRMVFSPWN